MVSPTDFHLFTFDMSIIQNLKSSISLTALAERFGYAFDKRKSSKSYAYYENDYDKILIYYNTSSDISSYYYTTCNNPTDSGDIINFLVHKGYAQNTKTAISILSKIDPTSAQRLSSHLTKRIEAPKKAFKSIETFPVTKETYLCHPKCGVKPGQLNNQYFQNRVFNGSRKHNGYFNTIFPIYRLEKVVGQEIRNQDYKHIIEGSQKTEGLWQSNPIPGATSFMILESPKDAFAYQQITRTKHPMIFFSTLGSPSQKQITYFLSIHRAYEKKYNRALNIFLAGDNDIAGQLFNLNILLIYITTFLSTASFTISRKKEYSTLTLFYDETLKKYLNQLPESQYFEIEHDINSSFKFNIKNDTLSLNYLSDYLINIFSLLSIFSQKSAKTENGDFTDDLILLYKNKALDYSKP